ncbi:membrane hypothetical protein [Oceanicaulis sp. 350]|nr:membrane hypothetical protein [Oceanicaulis sp. 350]
MAITKSDTLSFRLDAVFIWLFLLTFCVGRVSNTFSYLSVGAEAAGVSTQPLLQLIMMSIKIDPVTPIGVLLIALAIFAPNLRRKISNKISPIPGFEEDGNLYTIEGGVRHASERSDIYRRIITLPVATSNRRADSLSIRPRIAHELVHANYRDFLTLRLYILASLLAIFSIIQDFLLVFPLHFLLAGEGFSSREQVELRDFIIQLTLPALTVMRTFGFLSRREFRADALASIRVGREEYLSYLRLCRYKELLHTPANWLIGRTQSLFHPSFERRYKRLAKCPDDESIYGIAAMFGALSASLGGSLYDWQKALYRNPGSCGVAESDALATVWGGTCDQLINSVGVTLITALLLSAVIQPLTQLRPDRILIFSVVSGLVTLLFFAVTRVPLLWSLPEADQSLVVALFFPRWRIILP